MHVYVVRAEFVDADAAADWLAWLQGGHVGDVLAAGAQGAEIVQLDTPPLCYEVRYRFASRTAFDAYEHDHAPRLRAEGSTRFPPSTVGYSRSSGAVIWSAGA